MLTAKVFGSRLRALRKARGLSQAAVSHAAHLMQRDVSEYERGIRLPRLGAAKRIADTLGVSLDELAADGNGSTRAPGAGGTPPGQGEPARSDTADDADDAEGRR